MGDQEKQMAVVQATVDLVREMVAAQAQNPVNPITLEGVEQALKRIYRLAYGLITGDESVLAEDIRTSSAGGVTEARQSIQEEYVICLECGAKMRQITGRHLEAHGLSIAEYKKKWGFRAKDSLACLQTQRERSQAAKERGIPPKLKAYQEKRRQAAAPRK